MTDCLIPGIDRDLRDGVAIAIGFALLSGTVMFVLGFAFALLDSYIYFLSITGLVFLLTFMLTVKRLKNLPGRWAEWSGVFNLPGDRILWSCIGILTLLYLVNAGDAAVGWDAAVHHYAFPKALLLANSLIDVPGIPFSYYPSLGEMLFTYGLAIDREFLAGSMTWIFLFPLIAGMISIGKSLGNPRIGLWGIAIFLGAPLTTAVPSTGVIDLPFFVFTLLATAILLDTRHPLTWPKTAIIGILIGCACATKHLGLLFLAAFIPIFIWKSVNIGDGFAKGLLRGLAVVIVSLLIPLPWYIRAWLLTGDPLYPFLSNIVSFAGQQQGSFSVESFARTDYPRTITGFVMYLWFMTMNYSDVRPWYLAVHPAWLALLPPAVVWAIKPPSGNSRSITVSNYRMLLILGLLVMAINFFLAPAYPRYIFPTWLCLSLVSAWTMTEIYRLWPKMGRIIILVAIGLPLIIVLGMVSKRSTEVIPQYLSSDARVEAIEAAFPGIETMLWANENISRDFSLVLSTDPKIYYLDERAIIAKPGIESSLLVPWDSEQSEILANWRELGVTHFILDTTLISVKHGFGIAFFSSVLGDRDAVWLDITTTRPGAEEFGIGDILTDEEFLYMSDLGGLPVVQDGTREGRHLFTSENELAFQSWGRDWIMAETILKFIEAGILVEEFRSGPGGGIRLYSVHLPSENDVALPELPDVTEWGLPYNEGPIDQLSR